MSLVIGIIRVLSLAHLLAPLGFLEFRSIFPLSNLAHYLPILEETPIS